MGEKLSMRLGLNIASIAASTYTVYIYSFGGCMMEVEIARLKSVESRLRATILTIVKRRRSQGEPLTWRLMFEIEDEATSVLRHQSELDEDYVRMLVGRSTPVHQRPDEPVCLTELHAMRVALWMIQEAYYHWH
jgi:hypothetical protein